MADEPKPEQKPFDGFDVIPDELTPVQPFVDPDAPTEEVLVDLKQLAKELLEKAGENWNVRGARDTGRVVAHLTFDGPNEFGQNMACCDNAQDVKDIFGGTMRVRKQELLREFGELILGLIAGKGPKIVDFKVERVTENIPAGCYVWRCDLQTFPGTDDSRVKELIDGRVAVAKVRNELTTLRIEYASEIAEERNKRNRESLLNLATIAALNERLNDALSPPERSTVEEF